MAIANTRERTVRPIHPGEMLRERRALSPEMALRLSQLFGNSPEFWLNAQRAVDLWDASQELERKGTHIKRLSVT